MEENENYGELLKNSLELICDYINREFESKTRTCDINPLEPISIGYTTTKNHEYDIDIFVDLMTYSIIWNIGGEPALTMQFHNLKNMQPALEDLDFEKLVNIADEIAEKLYGEDC